ncbi:MAG: methyl-accepting chemotaxis protein [Acidimicrobiales bacterium]
MSETAATRRTRSASNTDRSGSTAAKTTRKTVAKAGATRSTATAKASPAAAERRREELVTRFRAEALDAASTAVMMVDRDLVIYYLNDAALELMRSAEDEFAQTWPGFSADDLIGQCIDRFHANPAHQRRLLDDPDNLPYKADISVGNLSFGLSVSAQFDDSGDYVGCTLEWEDLTELLDVRSKLASIDRYQAVAEYALDGTLLSGNDNFLEVMGYHRDDVVGRHHRIFCPPDQADTADYREMWTLLARGERQEGEVRRLNRAGETIWLRASYNPVLDRSGTPIKVIEFATDITEAKEAEATSKFRAEALGNVRTAVMMVDRDFVIYYVNDAATELMRSAEQAFRVAWPSFSADDLVGQCIDQFHANPSHQRRLLDDPSNLPYQADIEVAGLSFGLNVTAQIDPDGNYVGCTLEWENLTEFLDVSAKVEAIDRSQAMIEFTVDGTILKANDNFYETMGYTAEEVVGRHHRMFVDPVEANDPAYAMLWDRLSRGLFESGEYRRFTKAGDEVWLRANYNPVFDRSGKAVKVVKIATDVTEERRLQDQIQLLVARASEVMGAVAAGDLTQSIEGQFDGHLATLQDATNASIETLSTMVTQIRSSAVSMSSSASEVALANQDLSRRTESQASSLEETASSMEEMTATVQQNADNSRKASQLAVSAREQAQDGGQVVDRAVEAMLAISESSKKIADIIGVIDEIAFQTNLLALNAAVEAARAGDQGRGFAVVASEVRNLAQRSAGAAKEIKALIQDSLEKVSDGSNLVNQSGSQLEEIVNSVKKVSDIIAEIAAASEEQSAGITQVNQAVAEMDQGTQQNAAMVEEAAAASESMQQLAQLLLELTEQFRVSGLEPAAAAMAPVMAAVAPPAAAPGMAARPAPVTTSNGHHDDAPARVAHANGSVATLVDGDEAWEQF